MRKINATAFISLDGVMQAPGGPEEDPTGGFGFGGWTATYWGRDEMLWRAIDTMFVNPVDLLLGRKTYEIFAAHWPYIPTEPGTEGYAEDHAKIARLFRRITKYVASRSPLELDWENSEQLQGDVVDALRTLKQGEGPDLLTQGSSDLLQTLWAADLVDELRLFIFPVALGKGKRLFGAGTIPGSFEMIESQVSPSGVVIASYRRAGDVEIGSFELPEPTGAELKRRAALGA
ncbi:dihydrofolate reductase family protein [Sphingomonas koreensis]